MKNFIRLFSFMAAVAVLFCADALALNGAWRGELAVGAVNVPL